MALSVGIPSACDFRIKRFQHQHYHPRPSLSPCAPHRAKFSSCSMRGHLFDPNEVKMQIEIMRENSREAIHNSVKSFPWKKAASILIGRIIFWASRMAILVFIYSLMIDVLNAFYVDQVLAIPLGLFVGCLTTDFFRELLREKFLRSEEEYKWYIIGFMASMKIVAVGIASPPPMFIQHVANGGVMQALWLWWMSMKEAKNEQEGNFFTGYGLEAKNTNLERPFLLAKRVLSWFIFSYISYTIAADTARCFYANQVSIVPLGLLIGFLMADCLRLLSGYFKIDFLTKISQELYRIPEVNFLWGTLGLLAFIKHVISPFQPPMFLLQIANGGLVRALWLLVMISAKNIASGKDRSASGSGLEA